PLRFNGETFYQSTVGVDPITREETTGLQVVTNTGWMIPYVSCMIVAVGMLSQFTVTLLRFLRRLLDGTSGHFAGGAEGPAPRRAARSDPAAAEVVFLNETQRAPSSLGETALLAGVLVAGVAMVAYFARPPKAPERGSDLYAAGKIPIV